MPRAFTGCNMILYTSISKKAIDILHKHSLAQRVSRGLYLDTLLKKLEGEPDFVKVEAPTYEKHEPVKRRSPGRVKKKSAKAA